MFIKFPLEIIEKEPESKGNKNTVEMISYSFDYF